MNYPPTADDGVSAIHAFREWKKTMEGAGYRVIEEPWSPAPPEPKLPEPAVKPPERRGRP